MLKRKILALLCVFTSSISAATPSSHVNELLSQIRPQLMWQQLSSLTAFPDRSAASKNGVKAAMWIRQRVNDMIKESKRSDTSLQLIQTRWIDHQGQVTHYPQPSILLKIGNSTLPGIVIGAHLDTTAGLHRPGADDNGSGAVTLLEMARVFLNSSTTFKKPIYIVWYGAEEGDLDGSKSVVNYFQQHHMPVAAVMQLDMTGYALNGDTTLWLSDTGHYRHVNKALTEFTYRVAKRYVRNNIAITHLDDESDHWSWQEAGYKTVFPMEGNCHGNRRCPYREHTAKDTMDTLSLSHMTDYLKLAIAFTAELAM